MLWLRHLVRRMVFKIFLAIGVVLGVALYFKGQLDGHRLADVMRRETQQSAQALARSIVVSIDHSMLEGEGIAVKTLIQQLVKRLPSAEIRVYDQRGLEVFAPPLPPPPLDQLPADLAATLRDGKRRVAGDTIVRPIVHEERCTECHANPGALRGVLTLELDPAACAQRRDQAVARIVEAGFTHVMTARNAEELDAYFAELVMRAPGVRSVAVVDVEGAQSFGSAEEVALDDAAIAAVMAPGAKPAYQPGPNGTLVTVPLRMDERCVECHEDALGVTRGAMAVVLAPPTPGCATEELEALTEVSLRFIMLSALGRRIADFLDAVVETGAVRRLDLHDPEGRRYWTTAHEPAPPRLAAVLDGGGASIATSGAGAVERIEVIEPLENRMACMRCHGDDSPLRGAVAVSLSTAAGNRERDEAVRISGWFTAATLVGLLVILGLLLQLMVARPLNRIGEVAEKVGQGNLTVVVRPADFDGNEVSRLGAQVNQMVVGLRAKTHLEKQVSRGAIAAAEAAGKLASGGHPEAVRRHVTVLFSDIRGFTTYAEDRTPEEVVSELNELMRVQTEAVVANGGDLDKYVGDEVMALFWDPDGERRAVTCAFAMIEAVTRLQRVGLAIGVGINTGDVVYGAIGTSDRYDHTVIGDVVNTGARLCSAAAPNEVLISAAVRRAAGEVEGVVFDEREPLPLKGKKKPFEVLAARRG